MAHMSWRLASLLLTVSCRDDLTASDPVDQSLVCGGEAEWVDGPSSRAVRCRCYLDEIAGARKAAAVVVHPLADDRPVLPIEKLGELVEPRSEHLCPTIS